MKNIDKNNEKCYIIQYNGKMGVDYGRIQRKN